MKRGELSMGVIIGAAIALLILVILSVLIFRAGGGVTTGTSCESLREGAVCISDDQLCSSYGTADQKYVQNMGGDCGEGGLCCVPFP